MELSTSVNVLYDPERLSVEESLERLAKAGFRVLDYDLCDWLFEGSPFVSDQWGGWIEGIRRRADALGLRFSQAHGPIFNKLRDDKDAERMTELTHRSLCACGMLGVKWMVLEPSSVPGALDKKHIQETKRRNVEWFGNVLRTAEEVGVGIALENTADLFPAQSDLRRAYCSVTAELIELVDEFRHQLVGICWDTGHAHIQRLNQREALRAVGKRLKATHIQDNNAQGDQHLLPFYGTINWREIIQTLREIEYEGDFTYEVHSFIRPLPDELRDYALRYALRVGKYLLGLAEPCGGES